MFIYLNHTPAKFYRDPIWKDGAWGFFEDSCPNKKKNYNNKMSNDMKSVPDLKVKTTTDLNHTVCSPVSSFTDLPRVFGNVAVVIFDSGNGIAPSGRLP